MTSIWCSSISLRQLASTRRWRKHQVGSIITQSLVGPFKMIWTSTNGNRSCKICRYYKQLIILKSIRLKSTKCILFQHFDAELMRCYPTVFHTGRTYDPLAFLGDQVRPPQRLANHIYLSANNSSVHTYIIFKVYKRITVIDN